MKLLFISTSVGAFGSGVGGGVELTIQNLAQYLLHRGHRVHLVAPSGSLSPYIPIVALPGALHSFAQNSDRGDPIQFPSDSVVAAMLQYAYAMQDRYDLIVNFAYDWLPFYLTSFFTTPLIHFVSMGSVSDALDHIIVQTGRQFPRRLGMYTHVQAHSFGDPQLEVEILGSGIDLDRYVYVESPADFYVWIGRIAPEKGLEDVAAVSAQLGIEVQIFGKMQEEAYWQECNALYPQAKLHYQGFFPTEELQARIGRARALIMTPKWVEAFGNVAIEALACGVPVISYARGGPVEIIRHNETGYLVEPDNIEALAEAIGRIDRIRRSKCRAQAEKEYSLEALGERFLAWFQGIINGAGGSKL
ncbi:MAG: glycosyltransferase family 4 protein [Pseudanabaenaceae cyanobacterium]